MFLFTNMNLFLTLMIFFLTSCSAIKYPHNYFADCEKNFTEFSALSECAMKEINEDCQGNSVCKLEESRFVNIIKRLQVMVNNDEISENEAMFRYFNFTSRGRFPFVCLSILFVLLFQ